MEAPTPPPLLHQSSLSGGALPPPITGGEAVEAPRAVGAPRQPDHARRQPVGVLDLAGQHGAADGAALLRRHLLPPLHPGAARRREAAVRRVVGPAAGRLGAQPPVGRQRRLVCRGGLALGAGAGPRAGPGAAAGGQAGAQVVVLEGRTPPGRGGGAELVARLRLAGQPGRGGGALRVRGAAGRVVGAVVVLQLAHAAVERAALAHEAVGGAGPLLGHLLLGRLGADQHHLQARGAAAVPAAAAVLPPAAPHRLIGLHRRLHLLELHDGALLGAQLRVAAAQPLQVGRQLLAGLQDSHRGDGAVGAEGLEQQLHQLLLLGGAALVLGQRGQLGPALQVAQQQHAARQRLAGEDGHAGLAAHLAALVVQLQDLGVLEGEGRGSPVAGQVFDLQRAGLWVTYVVMGGFLEQQEGTQGTLEG